MDTPTGPPSKSRRSIRGEDVRFSSSFADSNDNVSEKSIGPEPNPKP